MHPLPPGREVLGHNESPLGQVSALAKPTATRSASRRGESAAESPGPSRGDCLWPDSVLFAPFPAHLRGSPLCSGASSKPSTFARGFPSCIGFPLVHGVTVGFLPRFGQLRHR